MNNCFDKEMLITRYRERYEKYGYSYKTLGWGKGRHYLRYHILLSHWDVANCKILDFGCGFGDMYDYCQRCGYSTSYTGIDIQPDLIREGKKQFPKARLIEADIFEDDVSENFDYIFSSGVHNLKLNNNQEFINRTFDWFNQHATSGFAVNFLSNRVDFQEEQLAYTDPCVALDIAYQYSNNVVLKNNYMPYEFTIFVDKNECVNNDNVYLDFVTLI